MISHKVCFPLEGRKIDRLFLFLKTLSFFSTASVTNRQYESDYAGPVDGLQSGQKWQNGGFLTGDDTVDPYSLYYLRVSDCLHT